MGRMTPIPIGRVLAGHRCSAIVDANTPAPPPSPSIIIDFSPHDSGAPSLVTRMTGSDAGTPEHDEAPFQGAPLLNRVDRTLESLEGAVDATRCRGLDQPRPTEEGEDQPNDDTDQLLPTKSHAAAGQVELVGEE